MWRIYFNFDVIRVCFIDFNNRFTCFQKVFDSTNCSMIHVFFFKLCKSLTWIMLLNVFITFINSFDIILFLFHEIMMNFINACTTCFVDLHRRFFMWFSNSNVCFSIMYVILRAIIDFNVFFKCFEQCYWSI